MLTNSKIHSAKPQTKTYKLTDALGLYLLVSPSGSRLWYYRYSFGAYPQVTLAEAREKRDAARKLLKSGICPSLPRKSEKKP